METVTKFNFLTIAKNVLSLEAQAIENLINNLDNNFNIICEVILACKGKLVITGMGKSGHIARKIAATMASTGTPAFFIHPAEASHGDLGMIGKQDLVLIFSNSGETDELINILPMLKKLSNKIIAITNNSNSKIAKYSDFHILMNIQQEACPLNLAPTTSTTTALAIGDAIAISLLKARGFDHKDFARYHPSGRLGKRLLLKISDIMHTGKSIPVVSETTSLLDAIVEMSNKCFGLLIVVKSTDLKTVIGVLSDGDLRRIIDKRLDVNATPLVNIITKNFKFISSDELAIEAINIMEKNKILALPVINNQKIVGIFNMHDLLKAGLL
jgi:arabinose-5-phosphate isomerase